MLSIAINPFMEEIYITNNKELILLLLAILRTHLQLCILSCVILLYYRGYQPPSVQNQDNSPSVGYRPPLFPGSAELAEVVEEVVEEVSEKKSVKLRCCC